MNVLVRTLKVFIETTYEGCKSSRSPKSDIDVVTLIENDFDQLVEKYNRHCSGEIFVPSEEPHFYRNDYKYLYLVESDFIIQ